MAIHYEIPQEKRIELQKKKESSFIYRSFHSFLYTAKWMILTFVVIAIATKYLILNAIVPTSSMDPTLPVGSIVICSRLSYNDTQLPQRGDIIVFTREVEDKALIKRVIGLPGDLIEIINGVTYINGEVYEENYLCEIPDDINFGPFLVPNYNYFCMGDNRNDSYDSRYWEEHFVPIDRIEAKAIWMFFSSESVGFL